jgi:hypothetical protein
MYRQTNCPCCGTQPVLMPAYFSQFVIWRTTGTKPESNVSASLAHCKNCDFYFSPQRFDDNEIERLYQGYRNTDYNSMRQECEPNYQGELYSSEYVNQRKEFINVLINKHTTNLRSILDYGGDDGAYIPDVPIKFVYDVSGVEPKAGVNKHSLDSDSKYDLVMNCQVLEHVPNIDKLVDQLKKCTKEYLYIEVPAYRNPPLDNMIIGEHINFFRQSSLHALLNKHNIKIIDTAVDYDLRVLAVLGKI